MKSIETRRVGKHLFVFEKGTAGNTHEKGRTLITACDHNDDEKLPLEFINYMRTLFDILDERRRGFVKLTDIEARWGQSRNGQFEADNPGVLESLRKVAPANGLLSFERLCLGFQIALRPTNSAEKSKQAPLQKARNDSLCKIKAESASRGLRSDTEGKAPEERKVLQAPHRRPRSMVQLRQQKEPLDLAVAKRKGGLLEGIQKTDKETVVAKLKQWHRDELGNDQNNNVSTVNEPEKVKCLSKMNYQARRKVVTQEQQQNTFDRELCSSKHHLVKNEFDPRRQPQARVHYHGEKVNGLNGGSRDSVRALTHQSTTSKAAKLKDMEEELKILSDGLHVVEDVRDWLFTQMTAIQEERLYLKNVKTYSSENYEAVIHGHRRQKLGLIPSNFRAFESHIKELKSYLDQIVRKTPELSLKEDVESENKRRIAQLEKEKRALIRELFHYKSQQEKTPIEVS